MIGVSTIFQDITEAKQLQETRARLAAIVENSYDAIFSRTLEGTILTWNAGAEKMFGYSALEMIGKQHSMLAPPGRAEVIHDTNRKILRGELVTSEGKRVRKDGLLIDVRSSNSPIRNTQGDIVGVASSLQDITDSKRAEVIRLALEEQLRESQNMEAIGRLAGGIAHDFNNALAAILGNVELARLDAAGNDKALESLDEIQKASTRARELVQQILAFSRRQAAQMEPISLTEIIEECGRLLRATLPARISLAIESEPSLPKVLANAGQIHQVLINLGTNAMQAIGPVPGRISMRVARAIPDDNALLESPGLRAFLAEHPEGVLGIVVTDTGAGMDDETRKRIFEPFFTTKRVGEGTGLGLSVVHGIVQSHHGVITGRAQKPSATYLGENVAWGKTTDS
jgi:PAS domain S-box-containing protein